MKNFKLLILGCIACLSACDNSEKKSRDNGADSISSMKLVTDSNIVAAAVDSSTGAKDNVNWRGTYQGVIPCADCAGTVTEIMLHQDSTYMMSVTYLGKKDSKAIHTDGKFKWLGDSTIQLEGTAAGSSRYFVAEDKLVQLDEAGKANEGATASRYILKKK